jgi:tRNA A-37 threonylcarbamoyl transferase component Bud32
MIGKKIGGYRVTQEIGDGGHAFVFKGEGEGEVVAVKMLKPSALDDQNLEKRFLLEAESLKKLRHPNIVGFKGYHFIDGYHYLVLEYMDQGSVDNLFQAEGPIQAKYALPIFYKVLEGISVAHDQGIIHRDLKPNNILINSAGEAKLSDFGIAKVVGGQNLTSKGYALGTMGYMAPELISQGVVSVKTDIYALGVTLYEMLTTRKPFEFERDDESPINFARRVCQGKPTPPSVYSANIPQPLEKIVMKALAQNADDRYKTARDMAKDLKKSFPELVAKPIVVLHKRAQTSYVKLDDVSRALQQVTLPSGGKRRTRSLIIAAAVAGVVLLTAILPTMLGASLPMSTGLFYGLGAAVAALLGVVLHLMLPREGAEGLSVAPEIVEVKPPPAPVDDESEDGSAGDTIPMHDGFISSAPFQMTEISELKAYLTVVAGPDRGRRFGLRPISRIGRDLRLDIRPHDPEISRHHCVLTFDGQGFTAEDLGSTNGSFINEERIVGKRRLRHGDVLRVGASSMKFEFQPNA